MILYNIYIQQDCGLWPIILINKPISYAIVFSLMMGYILGFSLDKDKNLTNCFFFFKKFLVYVIERLYSEFQCLTMFGTGWLLGRGDTK